MQDLPLIDISTAIGKEQTDRATTTAVVQACESIGFMVLVGHGIPTKLINQVREDIKRYFSRPMEEKQHQQITRSNYRGYIPRGFFSPNTGGEADDYEGYKLHLEVHPEDPICSDFDLYGPNRWPDHPADLRHSVSPIFQYPDTILWYNLW